MDQTSIRLGRRTSLAMAKSGLCLALTLAGAGATMAQGPNTNEPPAIKALQDARFSQPVRVGALTGWSVIQTGGRYKKLGVVVGVFQPKDDDPELVFRYGGSLFGGPGRLVAPPLDVVSLVGPYVKIADLDPSEIDKLPTFKGDGGAFLKPNDVVKIGVDKKY